MARKLKPRNPRYLVNARLFAQDLPKGGSALTIRVYDQSVGRAKKLLGTIDIGQGSFGWAKNKGAFKVLRWTEFANLLNKHFDNA